MSDPTIKAVNRPDYWWVITSTRNQHSNSIIQSHQNAKSKTSTKI